jgi:hypothetical protein
MQRCSSRGSVNKVAVDMEEDERRKKMWDRRDINDSIGPISSDLLFRRLQ